MNNHMWCDTFGRGKTVSFHRDFCVQWKEKDYLSKDRKWQTMFQGNAHKCSSAFRKGYGNYEFTQRNLS